MVVTYSANLNRDPQESELEYIQRLCVTKDINNLSWKKLAQHINSVLGYTYSETYYRRNFHAGNFITFPNCSTTSSNDPEVSMDSKELHELRKERIKIADERSQLRAYERRIAREETLKEIAHDYAMMMNAKKKLPVPDIEKQQPTSKEGILLLSDWHYGMICDNPWNKFNPSICKERVRTLLDNVINIVTEQSIRTITVLNLSDLIAGRIHTQIRIESRFDVITQTMEVAEILAEFLNELSTYCVIEYYDCLDNHSRLEPNKSDSMDLESLVRIIPWYLRERFVNNPLIQVHDNEFGADIITCEVLGHNIIGVHGDNDRPTNALERLSLMTHKHYDMLCTAHLHHFSADEQHQSVVVSNSSLMGVDRYAEKLRLTSDPSQTFIVATSSNVCHSIYRIVLN